MIVAVDFDGMMTQNDKKGWQMAYDLKLREGCKEALNYLHSLGIKFVLWTCRTDERLVEAIDFLREEKLIHVFDAINDHHPYVISEWNNDSLSRKVWADYYLDDHNLNQTLDWYLIKDILGARFKERRTAWQE